MGKQGSYIPFFASAVLMYLVLFIIYPHYQYYIDPDGTAYLTISQRYADGDIAKAINGYWSPWSCWLTAVLIKWCGLKAVPASWLVNIAGATGFLFIAQSFFLRFYISPRLQWLLNAGLSTFLCYAVFAQSFDDLWECFFLLSVLRLLLNEQFLKRPALWVSCGVAGALAYFAKAYAFPFFILNVACCVYLLTRGNLKKWANICIVTVTTMVLCSLPWIVALHGKYGIWTTSTAGGLNMSWYLVGHPYFKEGVDLLIPPHYGDSPSYWEDAWFANGDTPQFWNSWQLLGRQVLRIIQNTYKFVLSGLQLSLFFPVIFVVALMSLFRRRVRNLLSDDARVMVVSFLLFPLAYFLINFESRYIWYMLPLALVMGATAIQGMPAGVRRQVMCVLFPLALIAWPVRELSNMYDEGRRDYEHAQQLVRLGIKGADFATMARPGIERQRMQRVAYFSGNHLYSLSRATCREGELLSEMRHYGVSYLFTGRTMGVDGRTDLLPDHDALPAPQSYIDSAKDDKIIWVDMY